ncbi:MAG: flagellar motor switch protein FliN [Hyphomicrobiales bacterium]
MSDAEDDIAVKRDVELDQLEGPSSSMDDRDEPTGSKDASDLEAVFDVPVRVSAVLGRSGMQVSELLNLGPGTVVELDRRVGEAIDIFVNDRLVARGEVVLVEDKLGVTMTEIIKGDK